MLLLLIRKSWRLVARLSGSNDVADYPNPDLAIEVDISPPEIDRAGIYAALMVSEVWRFDGQQVHIDRLNAEGKYEAVEASGFLPVTAEDIGGGSWTRIGETNRPGRGGCGRN